MKRRVVALDNAQRWATTAHACEALLTGQHLGTG